MKVRRVRISFVGTGKFATILNFYRESYLHEPVGNLLEILSFRKAENRRPLETLEPSDSRICLCSIPFLLFFSLIFLISSMIFVTMGRGERGSEQQSQSFLGILLKFVAVMKGVLCKIEVISGKLNFNLDKK